jgi:alpha-D-ribose 1-methylphosphonate 5-triphosphate synthase subunit PhnG
MLQQSDNHKNPVQKRSDWMALLARAPIELLEQALQPYSNDAPHWLRKPETGLMMIEGRTGGTGQRFNVGEVTVTRCALRLAHMTSEAPVGIAYILGRSHQHAYLAALADAVLLSKSGHGLTETLLTPIRAYLDQKSQMRKNQAESSKVEFFTVARESTQDEESEQS